jgi:hypothetical protein
MRKYDDYLLFLWGRFPDTYSKMRQFMSRGSCKCGPPDVKFSACSCNSTARVCNCKNPRYCRECPTRSPAIQVTTCSTYAQVEDTVRVYDIYPEQTENEKDFLKCEEFSVSHRMEFEALKATLAAKLPSTQRQQPREHAAQPGDQTEQQQQPPPNVQQQGPATNRNQATDESCIFADGDSCRLITVAHLSPDIIRLLGGIFNIPADFFNRHLPGTEAVSGRLISRLPSTLQIDFDELYESTYTYAELFAKGEARKGHKKIGKAIADTFLFRPGWDYFPVSDKAWEQSRRNKSLSSGFEILDDDLKNVFQFNLNHRVSVYSQPPGHPKTGTSSSWHSSIGWVMFGQVLRSLAIIVFYPMLQIHPSNDSKALTNDKPIPFRSNPNMLPNPQELNEIRRNRDMERWELHGHKQIYAAAYDEALKIHLHRHFQKNRADHPPHPGRRTNQLRPPPAPPAPNEADHDPEPEYHDDQSIPHPAFVHLFAEPLFKMVAANWARLIVRRSFDLDLLEWRPKEFVRSQAIDEIKSRRVAIARHQRHINSSMEVLRALMLEELALQVKHEELKRGSDPYQRLTGAQILALVEGMCSWNRGRSNGLVAEEANDDSWESVFWDFFELKASMDALEKRADKIHDGLLGLIQVVGGEKSSTLNVIAALVSIVLLPFTIVGNIYSSNLVFSDGRSTPSNKVHEFVALILGTAVVSAVTLGILYKLKRDGTLKVHFSQWIPFWVYRRYRECWTKMKDRGNRMDHILREWPPPPAPPKEADIENGQPNGQHV